MGRSGLFQDAGRRLPLGDTFATRQGGNCIGGARVFTVFGRILVGRTAAVGVYSDNVVVTITD